MGVLAAVHEHHGKGARATLLIQITTPDPHRTGSNRCRDMSGAFEKCDPHGRRPAIRMTGENNPFVVDTPFLFDQSRDRSKLLNALGVIVR